MLIFYKTWEPQPPGNFRACPGLYRYCFTSSRATGKRNSFIGLEWPRGFQEVNVPTFHDNGTGW
jgi:hypothetical protein